MEDYKKNACEYAADVSKQLITLSTGIITLTITFSKEVLDNTNGNYMLFIAWILFLLTIIFGVWTLMALTGSIEKYEGKFSIYNNNVILPSGLQIISFLSALICTIIYGCNSLGLFS